MSSCLFQSSSARSSTNSNCILANQIQGNKREPTKLHLQVVTVVKGRTCQDSPCRLQQTTENRLGVPFATYGTQGMARFVMQHEV